MPPNPEPSPPQDGAGELVYTDAAPTQAGTGGRRGEAVRRARVGAYLALHEALTLAAVLAIVAGVAAAFTWPWLPRPPIGGSQLATYAPVHDGDARLVVRAGGDGEILGWQAQNIRLIPGLRVASDLRKAIADGFLAALRRPGESEIPDGELEERLAGLTIVETRNYELGSDGKVTETWEYTARDDRGDRSIALYYPQLNRELIADPPVTVLPAGLGTGEAAQSKGKFGTDAYTWEVRLLSAGPYDGAAGRYGDCLQYETVSEVAGSAGPNRTLSRDWYCAGRGWVEGQQLEEDGTLKQRSVWAGASGAMDEGTPLPPAPAPLADAPTPDEPDRWRLSRLGRTKATGETSESTILPTWLQTDPPLLLAAGFASDLVAFDTFDPGAPPRWRFHTGGTVYGQPAYDRDAGRVYFGSSDKRLYALDTRGLFLWSFELADNVAARPLVADDLVVAAGEDGMLYGLDAATGHERWRQEIGSGIASWPALANGTIIMGADDGEVRGIDPASGETHWTLTVGAAVEAPIVVDERDGTAYAAGRDGTLTAFKPASCTATCEPLWTVEPGESLRTAPLPIADMVVTIDEDGTLTAVNKQDGKRRWSIGGAHYVGAPVLARGAIVAAAYRGTVDLIGLDGTVLDHWDARTAANPADGEPGFTFGPVVGGDAIWLGDSSAVVRRLGAPPLGQIPSIEIRWIDQSSRPPFAASQLRSTVVEHDGKAIVVDLTRSVFEVDPATGSGVRLADQPGELLLTQVDPLVVGDLLLTVGGRTMHALDLRTGQIRWRGIAPGTTIRPPAVVGDRVLWVNTAEGEGSLLALDLASGTMRWHVSLGGVSHVGGVAVTADQAFTNTPPAAFDLATGAQLWRSPVLGAMFGGPIVGPDGHTVYMGGVNATQTAGTVAALDAATGEVRWQIDLADAVMAPLDRLWAEGGLVIVPDLNGKVVALDAETGAERWRFTPPVARLGAITVEQGRVWFMLENARLYGLDLASGRPMARLTELELGLNGQGLTQRPVFIGDRLIYPAGLLLLGLDPPEGEP